ncbi:hypothetical protein ACSETR_09855 [Pseudomonas aeruginosa]|uniref:hypothetical protein n=1 Tax=Pseudomonas aeruginosa TaxID=287 RepID=UPI000425445F|nr:hypothetical protein [Pseudomonas aeruginosa]ALD84136.1 hypothetical protein PA1S_21350 [Pseudomonas aeruginosa PA1]ALE49946.1 hypothetical protein AOD73_21340 [Pseudomonas aeruginosa]MDP5667494.1 hypothetical protein [Pseudomonas aeruginosa]HEH9915214.1 hypothetical protein [Pseudomonas aeruginosa]HEH9916148.1 hypothetical protein [Pseudomonas aeruginosa]
MTTHLITLVIKQPSDAQARQLMYQELPDHEVEQARKQVLELHAKRRRPGRLHSPASLKV